MTTQNPPADRKFEPNMVWIPDEAVDENGEIDLELVVRLYADGDNQRAELYDEAAWVSFETPVYRLRNDVFIDRQGRYVCDGLNRVDTGRRKDSVDSAGEIRMLPDLWIIKLDETTEWNADYLKAHKIKRVTGVYAVDRAQVHYLCSLEPNHCLVELECQLEFEDEDAISNECRHDIETEFNSHLADQDDKYVSVKCVFRWVANAITPHHRDGRPGGYKLDCSPYVTAESAIEHLRENLSNLTL